MMVMMTRSDSSEVFALAQELANRLGEGFEPSLWEAEDRPHLAKVLLIHPDHRRILMHYRTFTNMDRRLMSFTAVPPEQELRRWGFSPGPSVNITISRDIDKVAADLKRRLLPELAAYTAKHLAAEAERRRCASERENELHRLAALLPRGRVVTSRHVEFGTQPVMILRPRRRPRDGALGYDFQFGPDPGTPAFLADLVQLIGRHYGDGDSGPTL